MKEPTKCPCCGKPVFRCDCSSEDCEKCGQCKKHCVCPKLKEPKKPVGKVIDEDHCLHM